ncbi:hypothetical protein EH206_19835 [Brenneria nigrifluens DSM 30175 = ATCC 13028]|uniref:Uncharacterized protein n=1 Tax=Brenneria nigrifluens DSM 30175 = ATCC 13028 TaxID=1121120 RepID=A0A2U1UP96_9GAMM|nr:hypothetical protein DDT54_14520 [Brenneria nigrifluens DSM 30175 = ATCC 13028]QCR06201.1 hypothetical protein EH206_19835 [Brenneria nigrifluens DSM 30175 = ATCC 13028]
MSQVSFSINLSRQPGFFHVQLRKALLNYCQFSSRYPSYLAGENPNTFNPAFSNGSIMDIGFYCLAFAVALWRRLSRVLASATLLG